jgi:valyl-tRNA synthetase
VRPEFEAYVSLEGLIDFAAEIKRQEKDLAELVKRLQAARAKLGNASFVDKAPPEVVQQQRDLVVDLQNQIQVTENTLKELRQG